MKVIVCLVFISVGILVGAQQVVTDFCASGICPAGVNQTGCNNTGAFGPNCPADVQIVNLTTTMIQAIAARHNQYRNQIAGGNLTGFDPAIRMATMSWNAELAEMALFNAITCVFAHDACRATTQFNWSGQNIAKTWWSGGQPADLLNSVILPQVDAWWSEYENANMSQINSYPSVSPSKTIGHFTVITAEKNTALGCGAVMYNDPAMNNWQSLTLTCNYARTNIVSLPMYRTGVTASLCSTGVNPNYPALCSLNEAYDVNVA